MTRAGWVAALLAILMEAGWITVAAGLLQAFAGQAPVAGLVGTVLWIAGGFAAARWLGPRLGSRWIAVGTVVVFAAGIAGVAASPTAWDAIVAGDVLRGVGINIGGALAGLAVLRGYAAASARLSVEGASRTLFVAIPCLALAAAVGGMSAEPFRSTFLRDAGVGVGLFAVAAMLRLALAGHLAAQGAGGVGWRGNPVWIGLVVAAVAGLLVVAIPVGLAGGPSIARTIEALVAASLVPISIAGLLVGGRTALRRIIALVGVWLIGVAILFALAAGQGPPKPPVPTESEPTRIEQVLSPTAVATVSGLGLIVVAIIVVLLIRSWMRGRPGLPDDLRDVRSHTLPAVEPGVRVLRRRRRRPWTRDPRTASEAWLALVEDLRESPDVRRQASETPAEHARRLRTSGLEASDDLGLPLLAADLGLDVYGGRPVSAAETRRAVARWRRLRVRLRPTPGAGPAAS